MRAYLTYLNGHEDLIPPPDAAEAANLLLQIQKPDYSTLTEIFSQKDNARDLLHHLFRNGDITPKQFYSLMLFCAQVQEVGPQAITAYSIHEHCSALFSALDFRYSPETPKPSFAGISSNQAKQAEFLTAVKELAASEQVFFAIRDEGFTGYDSLFLKKLPMVPTLASKIHTAVWQGQIIFLSYSAFAILGRLYYGASFFSLEPRVGKKSITEIGEGVANGTRYTEAYTSLAPYHNKPHGRQVDSYFQSVFHDLYHSVVCSSFAPEMNQLFLRLKELTHLRRENPQENKLSWELTDRDFSTIAKERAYEICQLMRSASFNDQAAAMKTLFTSVLLNSQNSIFYFDNSDMLLKEKLMLNDVFFAFVLDIATSSDDFAKWLRSIIQSEAFHDLSITVRYSRSEAREVPINTIFKLAMRLSETDFFRSYDYLTQLACLRIHVVEEAATSYLAGRLSLFAQPRLFPVNLPALEASRIHHSAGMRNMLVIRRKLEDNFKPPLMPSDRTELQKYVVRDQPASDPTPSHNPIC